MNISESFLLCSCLSPLNPNLRSSLTAVKSVTLLSLSLNSLPALCLPPGPVLMWVGVGQIEFCGFVHLSHVPCLESQGVQPSLAQQLLHLPGHVAALL